MLGFLCFLLHIVSRSTDTVTEFLPLCSCRKPHAQAIKRLKVHIRCSVVSSAVKKTWMLQNWPCYHGVFLLLFPQDLKSGRTCLHMASEEANVELFQLFLDHSSSLSIVNVKVSCFDMMKGCSISWHCRKQHVMCSSVYVSDVQWKHSPAHRQLFAKS